MCVKCGEINAFNKECTHVQSNDCPVSNTEIDPKVFSNFRPVNEVAAGVAG